MALNPPRITQNVDRFESILDGFLEKADTSELNQAVYRAARFLEDQAERAEGGTRPNFDHTNNATSMVRRVTRTLISRLNKAAEVQNADQFEKGHATGYEQGYAVGLRVGKVPA